MASDGGIFSFGDAHFYGSTARGEHSAAVAGMAADVGTGGYWLAGSDGGVAAFNAPFDGEANAHPLDKPIVAIAAAPGSDGYYLVASDGGIFAYDAQFFGSSGGIALNKPIVGISDL